MTVAHASLLRFLECMNSNVDQFLSHDPAEVTCDNTLTATFCYVMQSLVLNFMNFILFQLKFLKFKLKIKFIKFELHNPRLKSATRVMLLSLHRSLIISSQAGRRMARALLTFKRPTRRHRTATVPIIGNFQFGVGLRQMLLLPEF